MASRRGGAARKPRPAAAAPNTAELERLAEELLRTTGVTPDVVLEDLLHPERPKDSWRLRMLIGMVPFGARRFALRTTDLNETVVHFQNGAAGKEEIVLDEAQAQWFDEQVEKTLSIHGPLLTNLDDPSKSILHHGVVPASPEQREHWNQLWHRIDQQDFELLQEAIRKKIFAWQLEAFDKATTAHLQSRAIEPSVEPQKHEQPLPQDDNIIIKPDGTLIKSGVPYRSLLAAAPEAQVHPTTLLRWIKNPKFKLEGRPIQTYYFAQAHTYFISEESVQRMINRFVKWVDGKPAGVAGSVTLGETDDRSGYLRMSDAADIAGVSKQTMFLWASHTGKPLTDKPLDVIKCTASSHFYIRESDAHGLRKLVPRSGLHAGRRPQLAPQPA